MSLRLEKKPNHTRKKSLMPYEIVIVCVRPVDIVMSHALIFCKHYHLPSTQITLFFQTLEEAVAARHVIPTTSVGRIVTGRKGVAELYNFVFSFYPEGKPLVFIHEAITGVYQFAPDAQTIFPISSMIGFMRVGFSEAQRADSGLWGIYPVASAAHMTDAVDVGLKRISNQIWGCMNPGSVLERKQGGLEDYEIPVLFHELYGRIVRLRGFAANPIQDDKSSALAPPSPRKFCSMYSNVSRIDSKGNLRLMAVQESHEEEKEAF